MLCYVRKSWTPKGSNTASPEQQRAAILGLVEARGFVCEWYEDIEGHRSGRSEEGRPAWLKLKTQLTRTDVVGVAGYDLSRLYRNVKEFLAFIDDLEKMGKRLLLCQELIDTGTASGRAIATMLVTMHQLQADRTSERVTANIEYRRRVLGQHHGPIPYGCDRVKGKLVPAKGEATKDHEALLYLYTSYVTEHLSYDRLAERMNTSGYTYRDRRHQPRSWNREDVRRALANHQIYTGHLPIRRDSRDQPDEVLYNTHAPIVDPDLCTQVAREIEGRRHPTQRGNQRQYLLGGIAYCATCGRKLAGYHKDEQRYYRHQGCKLGCPEKWQDAECIEAALLAQLSRLDDEDFFAHLDTFTLSLFGESAAGQVVAQIQKTEQSIHRLSSLYLDDHLSRIEYDTRYRQYAQALESLRAQLPDSQARAVKDATARLRDLVTNLTGACFARQKSVIQNLAVRIDTRALCVVEIHPQSWVLPIWPAIEDWLRAD